MAVRTTVWGNNSPGPPSMKVGIEFDLFADTQPNGAASVAMHLDFYTQNGSKFNADAQAMAYTNSPAYGVANKPYTNDEGTAVIKRDGWNYIYNYPAGSYGSSPGTITVTAKVNGAQGGSTPECTVTFNVPPRAYAAPAPPTSVGATRLDDNRAQVTWANAATAGAPYTSLTIHMAVYEGGAWSGWTNMGNVSAGATSYIQSGLSPNRIYSFLVRSNNSVGSSGDVQTGNVAMTPSAPITVVGARSLSGSQILLTWTTNHYIVGGLTYTVQRSNNGGAWTNVATGVTTASWTDTAPPVGGAGLNRYRVATVYSGLTSVWTESNTVSSPIAPLAPTNLAPNGVAADLQFTPVVLTWQHQQGGDGVPQTHFTIQYSSDSGATFVNLPGGIGVDVASSVSTFTIPAGTLTNRLLPYQWKVKTEGTTGAGFGPLSAAAVIFGQTSPTVTIKANMPPAITEELPLPIGWVYNQDQGEVQTQYQIELYDNLGVLLQQRTGFGPQTETSFPYPVKDGLTYTVRVRAMSGSGLYSAWASKTTTMDLPPPGASHVNPEFDECTGVMILHLTSDPPVPGVSLAVATVDVERRVPGGDWVLIAEGVPMPTDLLDMVPSTHGINEYRVTSISVAPSYVINPVVPAIAEDKNGLWAFLSYGDGFTNVLRFHGEPSISATMSRTREVQDFLGRTKPVLLVGENRSHVVSAGGALRYDVRPVDPLDEGCPPYDPCYYDSPPEDWLAAGQDAEVVCFRDYTGRRLFGMISDVAVDYGKWHGHATVAFTVTESAFREMTGQIELNVETTGPPR